LNNNLADDQSVDLDKLFNLSLAQDKRESNLVNRDIECGISVFGEGSIVLHLFEEVFSIDPLDSLLLLD